MLEQKLEYQEASDQTERGSGGQESLQRLGLASLAENEPQTKPTSTKAAKQPMTDNNNSVNSAE